MFEYGYRKSNYGPDELVTDAHGNPISVVDAMLSAEGRGESRNLHAAPVLLLPAYSRQHRFGNPPVRGDRHDPAFGGAVWDFNLRDTKLRRAGLDYHDMAHVVLHPNFENLVESMPNSRIIAFTAHATKLYTDIEYKPTDILLFGPEPGNIPDPMDIMAGPHVAEQVRSAHAPVACVP